MADRFVWVSDVFAGQGDVSGGVGNVLDGQEDLSDRMDVPFVGTADVNGYPWHAPRALRTGYGLAGKWFSEQKGRE